LTWAVSRETGAAADFHAREVPAPARRTVWCFEPAAPAVILGSTQPEATVDRDACRRAGVDVVRRRSGGGAVLLVPGEVLWVDVVVPAGDPLWRDDIGVATHWLGDAWAAALASSGVTGASVHRGPLVRAPWSDVLCFAGLGPGEVTIDGRKVVGISQRRTRHFARFQCAALLAWDPAALVALLAPPRPTAADVADVAGGIQVTADVLASALVAHLPA
jgi:lipoate-protein ligase A